MPNSSIKKYSLEALFLSLLINTGFAQDAQSPDYGDHFLNLLIPQSEVAQTKSLDYVEEHWSPSLIPFALEIYPYVRDSESKQKL
ncbi:hypothetical protein N9060_02020, partial [Arenicella sp.]|nr:hypothetical protein [Arenicella sp.]